MSLLMHVAILTLLVLDLFAGGALVERYGGRWATTAFEFTLILGYVLLVLQLVPWRRTGGG
jgi:hypothetical protein